MLIELTSVPEGLLELSADRLHEKLDGPTLIHLPGRHPEPLFVSVLLHGNEDTGWEVMRLLLKKYRQRELPRALSLFIGNVDAAREVVRHLDGQYDYNRIWDQGESSEHRMMRQIVETMAQRRVFASIDIHNNTGLNPHYACINRLEQQFLHLATLFSRTVVYFIKPAGVQSMAFAPLCPAVTIECGKVGQSHGTEHVLNFVEGALHLDHFPSHPVAVHDYDLFHTVAVVKVPEHSSFGFEGSSHDFLFSPDLDHLNFRELPAGTTLAEVSCGEAQLEAWDEEGRNRAERYFHCEDGQLRTTLPLMPSMLTLNEEVIRQDCLCYLMERLPALG